MCRCSLWIDKLLHSFPASDVTVISVERKEKRIELVSDVTTAIQNPTTLPVIAEIWEIPDSDGQALSTGQLGQISGALDQCIESDEWCELSLAFPEAFVLRHNRIVFDPVHQAP